MSGQYLGRVTVRVNGETLESKPGATIDLGGITRESIVNDQAMGFKEVPKPSRIECEIAVKRGVAFEGLRTLIDATLVFEADTGQRYIVKDGYAAETLQLTGDAGMRAVFMGEPAQEVVS